MSVSKKWMNLFALLVAVSMLLGACATPTPQVIETEKIVTQEVIKEVVKEKTIEVEVEKEVIVTVEPEPVDRKGSWLDMVVVVEEPNSNSAITRLDVGEIDAYVFAVGDSQILQTVKENPKLDYISNVGGNDEITFNPVGPVFEGTGKLNPFAVPAIREAVNWLLDRNYIGQEIMGGLGKPRYLPIVGGFPDYAAYIDKCRELEAYYAYNPDKARTVISAEMEKLGATLVNGKWQYNGENVELIGLIRTEDERREIGDYLSSQLENIGFTVRRDYKTSAEASPIWMRGNPNDGLFHFYTGGWIVTWISRDQGNNFDYYFTPRGRTNPLWQAYTPSPELDAVANRLNNNDFKSLDERRELWYQALELAMKDSVRIWVVDELAFSPTRENAQVVADLAGGIQGSWLWASTLRREGEVGGAMTIANASILTDPWNPIGGSNWIYDMMLIRGTSDRDVVPDPFTGLAWPNRIERAEITMEAGMPVQKTLDWVSLDFAPEIKVPADAWIDWDAAAQQFITVGEKNPEGLTALMKSVVYYPADLYDLKWHDGSNFSIADILMGWIVTFDLAKEESPLFDAAQVPTLQSFQSHFKGFRIVQEDPLVVEYYSDQYYLDAELSILNAPVAIYWPYYNQGQGSWHALAAGMLAEANKELAFSADKADELEVEWMSMISGPSIEILAKYLQQAKDENYIPYAATLGQYISADEAAARWNNLMEWYRVRGHFWVGTGPFFLERAFPIEGTMILRHNPEYPNAANRWDRFNQPRFPEVEIEGSGRVKIGSEASYTVNVSFQDTPYAIDDISSVKYLVFDAKGALVTVGESTPVKDGEWQVTLSPELTSKLEAGSNRIEIAVVSKLVSIPSFASIEFVSTP